MYFNVSVDDADWSWDRNYIYKKIYWCYFKEGVWVSLHEKARCNIRIYHKTRIYLQDINTHSVYLKDYWFNLKNCTGTLFGIYKLYYKLLIKCLHKEVPKSDYHNIVHGPQTVEFNWHFLQHIIDIIYSQIREIYHMVSSRYILQIQDYSTMIGIRANKEIEKFLLFDEAFFGDFSNGKPISLNWM